MDSVCSRTWPDGCPVKWNAHRLPKDEDLNIWGEALVTTKDGFEKVATWSGSEWMIDGGWCESTEVVAWMPLPLPYMK
jgi:hypothetical protein